MDNFMILKSYLKLEESVQIQIICLWAILLIEVHIQLKPSCYWWLWRYVNFIFLFKRESL